MATLGVPLTTKKFSTLISTTTLRTLVYELLPSWPLSIRLLLLTKIVTYSPFLVTNEAHDFFILVALVTVNSVKYFRNFFYECD